MTNPRYFTVDEANALIPELQQRFGRILQMRSQLRATYTRLEELGEAPSPETLMRTEGPHELLAQRGLFRALMEALQEEITEIEAEGVQIKDLDIGLCDFMAERGGRTVFLCWKYGENHVGFWHELHTGFAGRQPVDAGHDSDRPPRMFS